MAPDDITDPVVVKDWSYDEQVGWAEDYGRELWKENGDDDVVSDFTDDEAEEDKDKSWNVVYSEHERQINSDVYTVVGDDRESDQLIMAMREGFMSAYEEARKN